MGRVKLQIKRIENTTNRQVTFSKRRNGLIKKAYELSVLCDVDVALIMFSPSGRVSLFSGNKSVEEILVRYFNIPEHERGRLHNQELLQRALGKLRSEANQTYQESSQTTDDPHIEEIQQQILKCKSHIQNMEKRLRMFEGDPSESTSYEIEYWAQILQETLKQVRMRKQQLLEENYNSPSTTSTSQLCEEVSRNLLCQLKQSHLPPETPEVNGLVKERPNNILEWFPQRDPQVQILNFLDSNGLFPLRDQPQSVVEILRSPSNPFTGENINIYDDISPRGGLQEDNNTQRPAEIGQAIDVNLSPWTEFYPTGNGPIPTAQPRARDLIDLYSSQFTPTVLRPSPRDQQPA